MSLKSSKSPASLAKPQPVAGYASLERFYSARDTRFGQSEVDYGCMWRWGNALTPRYRVTYVRGSGEIYVMQFGGRRNGRVEVYGHCPTFEQLEEALAGWAEAGSKPRSLRWLVARLEEAGLDRPPPRSRLGALAASS